MITKEKFIKFIRNTTDDDIKYIYSIADILSILGLEDFSEDTRYERDGIALI